jgi:hypothetical protein
MRAPTQLPMTVLMGIELEAFDAAEAVDDGTADG